MIGFVARVVIWAIVALLTLDNLGIDVTALVAGLGIGGIAVALAVQNILGDLFASLSITFDKPFLVGDFLIVDDFLGSVEYIGIKSTRLRSLGGEQIIISNANPLSSRVRNYGRMMERRVVFSTSIAYETPPRTARAHPADHPSAIATPGNTRFDRSHFAKHGTSSLDFETVIGALPRLQPVHGHPAGHQPAGAPGVRKARREVCLPRAACICREVRGSSTRPREQRSREQPRTRGDRVRALP